MAGCWLSPVAELTDLPMIKEGRADRLRSAGIDTVEKLWKADLGKVADHPAFAQDDGLLGQLPLLQGYAEAHHKGAAVVYADDPRIMDTHEPILHMDLEFDGPASQIFLYGFLWHHEDDVWQWFDHERRSQEKMLRDFKDLCRDQDPTVVTWGGNASDVVQLRRACQKYGMDEKWLRKVRWLDLQTEVIFTGNPETQRVYLPVKNFSSDTVATYFGYQKPKLKVKDGYRALRMYQAYRRRPRDAVKEDLLLYNAEDMKHLKIVLNGLRELMRVEG